MKGISHFAIGIATASCFPAAVLEGSQGNPLYFVIGGIFGLLPDTIDFKLYRFFYPQDIRVAPDPLHPDAEVIARTIAETMNRACFNDRPLTIKLDTIRLGPDLWHSYDVTFNPNETNVTVQYGPVVNTNGQVVSPATNPATSASAPVSCSICLDYQATTTIDIFEGPVFTFTPIDDNTVTPMFIPWHRQWSHSLVIALLASLVVALVFGPLAGLIGFAAWSMHIIADQLGFMGSNLFFPFTAERSQGLKLLHSGDSLPNIGSVWISCLLIFWNLYCSNPEHAYSLNPVKIVFFGILIPFAAIRIIEKFYTARLAE